MITPVCPSDLHITVDQTWRYYIFDQLWLGCRETQNEYVFEYNHCEAAIQPKMGKFGSNTCRRLPLLNHDLTLVPALADRSVVVKTKVPLIIPSQQRVEVMIGTATWLKLFWQERLIFDLPTARLSDTWFGPNYRSGELCYAAQTFLRLAHEELPLRSYKAYSPIEIINKSDSNLIVDRINLPIGHLDLYQNDKGFMTTPLQLVREPNSQTAKVILLKEFPSRFGQPSHVANARKQIDGNIIYKASSWLFNS